MLELLQKCLAKNVTLKTVCFSMVERASGSQVRCTITVTTRGVKYLIFGAGSNMELAFQASLECFEDGEWRVAKFQE